MTGEPNETEEKGVKIKITYVAGGFVRPEYTVRNDDIEEAIRLTEKLVAWGKEPARGFTLEPQK
jgi:hypothetical protein